MIDSTVPHLPCLRLGKLPALINRKLLIIGMVPSKNTQLGEWGEVETKSVIVARDALQEFSTLKLIEICQKAGDAFA